ncbi:ABC transporter, (TAP family) [Reticulomyxa filosa]|uniref:ABC transporter, (TAP family) n=1 Tax=Reticulomyxa filosa TaxID=46433 RepID=X6N731_RETFI|nr:ABC transporter, (TAP family) [Reticulomyxa filosa]|eukprot:ETO22085.1 ABC transporter, (TAP family) [Reticulomyxa filosa]
MSYDEEPSLKEKLKKLHLVIEQSSGILNEHDIGIGDAMLINFDYVIRIALLLLLLKNNNNNNNNNGDNKPDSPLSNKFTLYDLFMKITAVSYTGDKRLDNVEKINNIVNNRETFQQFMQMYLPILQLYADVDSFYPIDVYNTLSLEEMKSIPFQVVFSFNRQISILSCLTSTKF